jgi:hypothetical protein
MAFTLCKKERNLIHRFWGNRSVDTKNNFYTHLMYCPTVSNLCNILNPQSKVFFRKLIPLSQIPHILYNPGALSCFQECPTVFILSQRNLARILPSYFLKIHFFILSSYVCPGLPSCPFPSGFQTTILCAYPFSPMHVTCHTHHILEIIVIFGEEYKI